MELIRIALRELWAHKGRSLAAMSGVMLGVVALIGMVVFIRALTESSRAYTRGWGGFNRIVVRGQPSGPGIRWDGFTANDVTALRQSCRTAVLISPEVGLDGLIITRGNRRFRPTAQGVTAAVLAINRFTVDQGRFISEGDLLGCSRTIVIGTDVIDALYDPHETALGSQLLVNGMPFSVVGTLAQTGSEEGRGNWLGAKDRFAFLPLTTAQRLIRRNDTLTQIQMTTAEPQDTTALVDEVRNVLAAAHGARLKLDIEDYGEQLRDEEASERNESRIWGLILGLTGVVALLVSAIGITNILLASIEERVREIGIRKAVGASELAIAAQFLVESLCLCAGGGLLGLAASAFVAPALLDFMTTSELLPPGLHVALPLNALLAGAVACVAVGLVAGIQPAVHAARLNAIEALRYE